MRPTILPLNINQQNARAEPKQGRSRKRQLAQVHDGHQVTPILQHAGHGRRRMGDPFDLNEWQHLHHAPGLQRIAVRPKLENNEQHDRPG